MDLQPKKLANWVRLTRYMGGITLLALSLTYSAIILMDGLDHLEEWFHIATIVPILVAPPIAFVGMKRKIAIEVLNEKLQHALQHDHLTQAHTRQALTDLFDTLDGERTVALIDIDHFKKINDSHGHQVGDEALKALVATCKSVLRSGDIVSRYGGEEFVLVLANISSEEVEHILSRLKSTLKDLPVVTRNGLLQMTVSIGVANCAPGESLEDAIARADAAMYRAKRAGRNRICRAPSVTEDRCIAKSA